MLKCYRGGGRKEATKSLFTSSSYTSFAEESQNFEMIKQKTTSLSEQLTLTSQLHEMWQQIWVINLIWSVFLWGLGWCSGRGAALLVGRFRDRFGVTGFFIDIFPSGRTMALGSTQPLVKMSTRNIPGDKSGRWVRLTISPPSCAECHENLRA